MITSLLFSSMLSAIPANMEGTVLPISCLSLEINSSSAFKVSQSPSHQLAEPEYFKLLVKFWRQTSNPKLCALSKLEFVCVRFSAACRRVEGSHTS